MAKVERQDKAFAERMERERLNAAAPDLLAAAKAALADLVTLVDRPPASVALLHNAIAKALGREWPSAEAHKYNIAKAEGRES